MNQVDYLTTGGGEESENVHVLVHGRCPATRRTQSQRSPPRQLALSRRRAAPARAPPSFFGVYPALLGDEVGLQFCAYVLSWTVGLNG